MKRILFSRKLKQTFLAVPAAAMMLGSSQAAISIGINFQGNYYGSYSGAQVTANDFGVLAANWFSAPDATSGTLSASPTAGGALTVNWSCANTWCSGLYPDILFDGTTYTTPGPLPGNGEVLWGYLDDTSPGNSTSVSGLSSVFANGYVVQTIAADVNATTTFSSSIVSDGVTTSTNSYSNYWHPVNFFGPPFTSLGTASLSAQSSVFTSDSLNISGGTRGAGRAPLCGFIITDKPVVSQSPTGATNNAGSPFILSAGAVGIPPLSYQWRFNGTPITGATGSAYTNISASAADTGNYDVVVTNLYGSGISDVATIVINQQAVILFDLPASVTNYSTMNAAFSVVAGGQPPLTYLWTRNGVPITNPTATVNLTNLQVSDSATYQVVVTNVFGAVTSSVASLVVIPSLPPYDGFNYSAGDLNGQNGGTGGWNGAWVQLTNFSGDHSVFSPATPWRGGISQLTSTGGALLLASIGTTDYGNTRSLLTTLGGNGYGTIYLSFVAQLTNTTWGGVELLKNGSASLFIGECWEGSDWGWGTRGAPDAKSTTPPSTNSLLVYRFDYTPTNTVVRLYINPTSLSVEPTNADLSGTEPAVSFNQISIASHGYYANPADPSRPNGSGPDGVLDELRVGGTWASVTPHTIRTDTPFTVKIVPGGVIQDTKPVGTPHNGINRGTTWLASSTGTNIITLEPGITRLGVEQFVQTNNSQITIAPNSDFNTATNGTICFWMQYALPLDTGTFPGPGTEAAMLFDRRSNTPGSQGTVITMTSAGKVMFQSTGGARFTGNGTVDDGLWHQVAVTYGQTTNDTVSIYIDGALDASLVNPGNWSWPTNQEIELGLSHDSYWFIYNGQMDDFRIYNRILTPTEIATIGTPATSDTLVDTSALKVRFNFDASSALFGNSVVWPFGVLQSSPALGAAAVWTSLTNAVSPQPFTPSAPSTFFRLIGTP